MTICARCSMSAANSLTCGDPCCSGCTHPDPPVTAQYPDTTLTTEAPSSWSWLVGKR